jgi:hypothetical protein
MAALGSMWSLADAMASLAEKFGDDLTLWRDGGFACWRYDSQAVIVGAADDGKIEARFVDRPAVDEVSGSMAAAVYQRIGAGAYPLTPDGGGRMAADMTAFFTGAREPQFAFVAVRELCHTV